MDFVCIRIVYDDWAETTPQMQRWIAEIFIWAMADGWQWSFGHQPRRCWIISDAA